MIRILDVRLLTLDIRDDWFFLKEIIIKILQSDNLCLNLPMYLKDVVNMATTAISPSTNQDIVSPLDALWSLYQSQSKRVRKAFRVRLLAEESAERERTRMMTYEQKMSDKDRDSVHRLVESVRDGVADVQNAHREGRTCGRKAEDFLKELQQESE